MKNMLLKTVMIICFLSCKSFLIDDYKSNDNDDLIIAFGSCNNQNLKNPLWDDILDNKPSYWIWGGDNIYSDTDNMSLMKNHYNKLLNQKEYQILKKQMSVHGTWDDHDYGLNDGGLEFEAKDKSQQLFLDFLEVPPNHQRRKRKGVYYSQLIEGSKGKIKLIILDTRYFRSALSPSKNPKARYEPNKGKEGTMLGVEQWNWLDKEIKNSNADFNLIVSSIQFVSKEHGYEKWANMPHETEKLLNMISKYKAKGVIILSGDRHISEFSKINLSGLTYPLVDFTSSGLTHAYSNFTSEPNQNRIGYVVSDLSFGLLKFNFKTKTVIMQMRGDNNVLQQELIQAYK